MKVLGCNDEIVDELVEVIVGVEVVAKLRLTLEVVIFDVANSLTFSIIIIVKTITSIHIKLCLGVTFLTTLASEAISLQPYAIVIASLRCNL